jgi:hypothetical protein
MSEGVADFLVGGQFQRFRLHPAKIAIAISHDRPSRQSGRNELEDRPNRLMMAGRRGLGAAPIQTHLRRRRRQTFIDCLARILPRQVINEEIRLCRRLIYSEPGQALPPLAALR